ncbi:Group XV phospholipase A2 [Clonorchis sinensis]|uniref:Group XV phospholipase A2 n=2 Tax=Clonorchis sinensis TaxID=79923 RepID=A0A8T1MJ67_CLOSI|nr:Group XV phospholipase A2 [Clonorchis sinensis]GAA39337.2 group XV phospholipase A2 [Clonorchis sinensis]
MPRNTMDSVLYYALIVMATTCFFTFLCDAAVSRDKINSGEKFPVVLVPGLGGSRIYYRDKNDPSGSMHRLWLNFRHIFDISRLIQLLSLQYDENTQKTIDKADVEIIVPGWGDTYTIEHLDEDEYIIGAEFSAIVEELTKDPFFIRNVSVRGTPYDFRRTPTENQQVLHRIKQLVEETYELNKQRKIVLIAHSLGTIYSLEFLKLQTAAWKSKYIKAFVSISGPFGGTVKAANALTSGEAFPVHIPSPFKLRNLFRTMPSVGFLLPDPRFWPVNEPIITTPERNYTANDVQQLFTDIGFPQGYDMWLHNPKQSDYLKGPTNVENVYCIYGTQLQTLEKLVYLPQGIFRKPFPDQIPTHVYGNGDGTVNLRSLQICNKWPNVALTELPGAKHLETLQDKRLLKLINEITGAKSSK